MSKMILIPVAIGDWLTEYLDLLDKYLQRYSGEFLEKLKVESEEVGDNYVDEYFLYARDYPNILRKSFFITCYSILEHELIDECKLQKKLKSLPIDVNDLRGEGGIDRAMKYLKLVGFDLSTAKSWEDIKNIQLIRNCIVHSDGDLTCNNSKQIRNYIDKRKDKDILIENDKIILTADYCRYVVNTFNAFEFDIKSSLVDSKGSQKVEINFIP